MLNVDLVGGMRQLPSGVRERRIPARRGLRGVASGEGFIQARRRYPESRRLAAYRCQ